jgi:hypothetical protein
MQILIDPRLVHGHLHVCGSSLLEAGHRVEHPGESAEFPAGVKEAVTLLVKSETRRKAVLHLTFEGRSDRGHAPGEAHSHSVGD